MQNRTTIPIGTVPGESYGYKNRCRLEVEIGLATSAEDQQHRDPGYLLQTIDHKEVRSDSVYVFAASGTVWRPDGKDCVSGGQNIDTIREHLNAGDIKARSPFPIPDFLPRLLEVWDRWHLNGLRAGCVHQKSGSYDRPEIRNQVCRESGYKYGSSWLIEPLPDDLREEIAGWIDAYTGENFYRLRGYDAFGKKVG